MSFWGAAWRIASDVAIYRIRKREAANLITSITLAAALAMIRREVEVGSTVNADDGTSAVVVSRTLPTP